MKGRGGIPRDDPELVPKCLVVIRASGASFSSGYPLDGICAIRHTACAFSIALKKSFNGDGAVASYLKNGTQGADDMSDHDEWISCSHWGMFALERKSSN
jgi:hypothetical protein